MNIVGSAVVLDIGKKIGLRWIRDLVGSQVSIDPVQKRGNPRSPIAAAHAPYKADHASPPVVFPSPPPVRLGNGLVLAIWSFQILLVLLFPSAGPYLMDAYAEPLLDPSLCRKLPRYFQQ